MRYLTIFLVTLITSCSWSLPWGASKTGNCLDDGNCEGANPFEEELKGGTWHCYGITKTKPWDCSQEQDDTKIVAVEDIPEPSYSPEPVFANEQNSAPEIGAEMTLADDIASSAEVSSLEPSTSQAVPIDLLYGYSDTSFSVQLIALKTFKEVSEYVEKFDLNPPMYVKVRSQESDWYAVLLGIYEARTEADAAAEEWASSHTTAPKPWVRPIPALRKAMNFTAP